MLPIAEFFEKNKGLVHDVSNRGYRRVVSLNVGLEYEDVFQEMSMAFLKAYEGFDESKGYKFTTYYYMAAFNHLNTWIKKTASDRIQHGTVSIEELNSRGDEDNNIADLIMVERLTPEHCAQYGQFVEHISESLSPLASWILEWTLSPPPELLDQVSKARAQAEYGRSLGIDTKCVINMSPRYVGSFILMLAQIPKAHIAEAINELSRLEYVDAKKYL